MRRELVMDDILKSSVGEQTGEIRVSFKKTIMVKQYEPEVYEVETVVKIDRAIDGVERMLLEALVLAQMEYGCYIQLYNREYVSEETFNKRKEELVKGVQMVYDKYISLYGKEPKELIDMLKKE